MSPSTATSLSVASRALATAFTVAAAAAAALGVAQHAAAIAPNSLQPARATPAPPTAALALTP